MDDVLEQRARKALIVTMRIGEDGMPEILSSKEEVAEPEEMGEEAEDKKAEKAGLAPELKKSEDKEAIMNGEEDLVRKRMKENIKPRGLNERAQRGVLENS